MPKAFPRSFASVNVVVSRDRAAGASSAPNTPCRARAVTRIVKSCARPPMADATANPASPQKNTHLRPSRSLSLPPNSSRLPNARA